MNGGKNLQLGASDADLRFSFGKNWTAYLESVDEGRIRMAQESLCRMFGVTDMTGRSFLDIGCGSGIFSLAARRLGAQVTSFDADPDSVACTRLLRERLSPDDAGWQVEYGSALDTTYLVNLGTFDFVYSWGVLHHTGNMWRALENALIPLAPRSRLFIAIYNDQGWISRYWWNVKRLYNRNFLFRAILIAFHFPTEIIARFFVRALTGRLSLDRGMNLWHDLLDWLGGFPFEYATPDAVVRFYKERGVLLATMKTCGRRHGCNEFVFVRSSLDAVGSSAD